jgi:hypothetical protein
MGDNLPGRGDKEMRERRLVDIKIVALAVLLSTGGRLAAGQDQSKKQSEWEAKAVAQMSEEARRKYERLKHPTFAQLELLPRLPELSESPEDVSKPYHVGDKIFFRLLVTNTSTEDVGFTNADYYYYDRPQLLRDGEVVPYRDGLAELLKKVDKTFGDTSRAYLIPPHGTAEVTVKIEDWYGPLEPGRYLLTVKRRFVWGGEWIESPSLMFEVVPK